MIVFQGKTKATVMIDNIDETTTSQIVSMTNHPAFKEDMVIMPDCHAGKGCVIGYTRKLEENICPNLIGVDISCGMRTSEFSRVNIDLQRFDRYVKQNIPMGMNIHQNKACRVEMILQDKIKRVLSKINKKESFDRVIYSIGTLGGGNHFLSLDSENNDSNIFFTAHTGSRNFGKIIAEYYQSKAVEFCKDFKICVAEDSAYMPLEYGGDDYIEAMKVAQEYASLNRQIIHDIVAKYLNDVHGINYIDSYECIHNYINFEDGVIRKGAISAHEGERLIVPLNMRDGIIFGVGKGNCNWNLSAPHGAGRVMSRSQAKKNVKLADYEQSMEGIYSSSVSQDTIDESPFAYKDAQMIIDAVKDTMDITAIVKPIYNVKSGKE